MNTGHHQPAAPLHDAYPIEANRDKTRSVTKPIRLNPARPTSRTPRSPPPTTPTIFKPPLLFSLPTPLSQHALAPTPPSPSQISNLKFQILPSHFSLPPPSPKQPISNFKSQISNPQTPFSLLTTDVSSAPRISGRLIPSRNNGSPHRLSPMVSHLSRHPLSQRRPETLPVNASRTRHRLLLFPKPSRKQADRHLPHRNTIPRRLSFHRTIQLIRNLNRRLHAPSFLYSRLKIKPATHPPNPPPLRTSPLSNLKSRPSQPEALECGSLLPLSRSQPAGPVPFKHPFQQARAREAPYSRPSEPAHLKSQIANLKSPQPAEGSGLLGESQLSGRTECARPVSPHPPLRLSLESRGSVLAPPYKPLRPTPPNKPFQLHTSHFTLLTSHFSLQNAPTNHEQ